MSVTDQPDPAAGPSQAESLIEQFESAWQSGQAPAIDEYLNRAGSDRDRALVELLHVDLERRLKGGEAVRVERYLERYPELGGNRVAVVGLICAEYELRRRSERGLSRDEYRRRFPQWQDALPVSGPSAAATPELSSMNSAPSLLKRLQQTGEQVAWERLVDLHSPLLYLWACRAGLQGPEAADLVTQVFDVVAEKLPEYRTESPGGFRNWLRRLAHLKRRELLLKRKVPAGPGPAAALADPDKVPPGAETLWEGEYQGFILARAAELCQPEFPANEWKACWGVAIENRPAADVARELGMTPAAVYVAESHVLRRLREELEGLIE